MNPFIYFPYIDMDEGMLMALSLYLEKIFLLCPSFWRSSEIAKRLNKDGIVQIKTPIIFDLNNIQVKRMLRELEYLVSIYQDSGYLEYMKIGNLPFEEDERCHVIIKEIKGYGRKPVAGGSKKMEIDDLLPGQLLLYLAQEFNRQRIEILSLFQELDEKEEDIKTILSVDQGEIEPDESAISTLSLKEMESENPGPDEDDFLIPQRLRAWNDMYKTLESEGEILFTDNRVVTRYILEESERVKSPLMAHIEEVMKFTLPWVRTTTIEESLKARAITRGLSEWRVFEKELRDFLASIERNPLDKGQKVAISARGQGLSNYVTENLYGQIIDQLSTSTNLSPSNFSSILFKVYVIPAMGMREFLESLFNGDKIQKGDKRKNGIFILIEKEPL
jgi:hypothetical protein